MLQNKKNIMKDLIVLSIAVVSLLIVSFFLFKESGKRKNDFKACLQSTNYTDIECDSCAIKYGFPTIHDYNKNK